ncbi:hypothetical protein KSP39_PZI023527 [Platanthera zijinensis]|uniref:Uncharacterized protein n=1 Tax=Platanthera zijinensis TaxID=2320716 RepID=A0AAP0FU97_9ASPA
MSISLCKLAFLHLLSWSRPIRRIAANRFPVDSVAKSAAVMVNGAGNGSELSRDPSLNTAVRRFRELMGSSATESDGWDKCWDAEVTPWDLGQATPIVTHLVKTGKLPDGRILVPGCGMGLLTAEQVAELLDGEGQIHGWRVLLQKNDLNGSMARRRRSGETANLPDPKVVWL